MGPLKKKVSSEKCESEAEKGEKDVNEEYYRNPI